MRKMKKAGYMCAAAACAAVLLAGCQDVAENPVKSMVQDVEDAAEQDAAMEQASESDGVSDSIQITEREPVIISPYEDGFDVSAIPENLTSLAYAEINGNIPYFSEYEYTTAAFEFYSELDELGRCGYTYANICPEIMPAEARGEIGQVKPTGWQTVKYDFIDGLYLYNRCHLIGYQLSGENANEKNLITGTRSFNVEGMLPFENLVADYVNSTGNHVLYRVTPVFEGTNPLADGVLMEGASVEDNGEGILFCVFAYNVEPGVVIDYATGDNWLDTGDGGSVQTEDGTETGQEEYILNTRSLKFHLPSCSSVEEMSESNKQTYVGTRDELIEQGYSPCGNCNP